MTLKEKADQLLQRVSALTKAIKIPKITNRNDADWRAVVDEAMHEVLHKHNGDPKAVRLIALSAEVAARRNAVDEFQSVLTALHNGTTLFLELVGQINDAWVAREGAVGTAPSTVPATVPATTVTVTDTDNDPLMQTSMVPDEMALFLVNIEDTVRDMESAISAMRASYDTYAAEQVDWFRRELTEKYLQDEFFTDHKRWQTGGLWCQAMKEVNDKNDKALSRETYANSVRMRTRGALFGLLSVVVSIGVTVDLARTHVVQAVAATIDGIAGRQSWGRLGEALAAITGTFGSAASSIIATSRSALHTLLTAGDLAHDFHKKASEGENTDGK